jgi:HEAT repeat protein
VQEVPDAEIDLLSSPNQIVRVTALDELEAGWPAGRPAVARALSKKSRMSDPSVENALLLDLCFVLIARKHDVELYSSSLNYFSHPDARIRQRVVSMARKFNDAQAYDLFLKGLGDTDPGVREDSSMGLSGDLKGAPKALHKRLLENPDESIRAPAVEAIAYSGDKTVHKQALELLASTNTMHRTEGCHALGYIGDATDRDEMRKAGCAQRDLIQIEYESVPVTGRVAFIDKMLTQKSDIEIDWAGREIIRAFQLKDADVMSYFKRSVANNESPAHDALNSLIPSLRLNGLW